MHFNAYLLGYFGKSVIGQIKDFERIGITLHRASFSHYKSGAFPYVSNLFIHYLSFYWQVESWELLYLAKAFKKDGESAVDLSGFSLPDLPYLAHIVLNVNV